MWYYQHKVPCWTLKHRFSVTSEYNMHATSIENIFFWRYFQNLVLVVRNYDFIHCRFQFKGQLTITRPPTPDDSGLEEDMSIVPADTLFELLRRTFHLSQENFTKYEHQIYRFHQRKEPSRVGRFRHINKITRHLNTCPVLKTYKMLI